jgi:hypothetical protein
VLSARKPIQVGILVKCVTKGRNDEAVDDEADRMAGLDHRNVLKALGISQPADFHFGKGKLTE